MTTKTSPNMLANADTTWIETILLDAEDNDATVTLNVPLHSTAGTADYEEIIDFASPNVPPYMREAAKVFSEAAVRFVRERAAAATPPGVEINCISCTGACCARVYSDVGVTPDDIERMGGIDSPTVKRGVDLNPHGLAWNGYMGSLKRTSWQGEGEATFEDDDKPMACVFLGTKDSLCTIYDIRPFICREYTEHDCDQQEQASHKLIQLRRKAMKNAEAKASGNAHGGSNGGTEAKVAT